MNKIQELINRLCPEGVEYKELGELEEKEMLKIGRGSIISKKDIRDMPGDFPVYSSSAIGDGEIGRYGKYMFDDERITWSIDGGGKFFYRNNLKYSVTNVSGWIKVLNTDFINTKFLYYVLINSWQKQEYNYTKKAHPSVIKKEYSIPVPPMEVQREIVRILDKFTLYSAELSAELIRRKKQYQYYREIILKSSFFEKIKLKDCLLNIENINWNKTNKKYKYIDLSSADREKHVILNTSVINKDNAPSRAKHIVKEYDVLFGTTRPMLKRNCLITNEYDNEICSTGFCVLRANKEIVLPEWIYYIINTDTFYKYIEENQKGASYPAISNIVVKDFKIPIPSLEIQKQIIEIMKKFEKLCNDIFEGLPAEIEARQKQYEYYRDKLLDFKRLENK